MEHGRLTMLRASSAAQVPALEADYTLTEEQVKYLNSWEEGT